MKPSNDTNKKHRAFYEAVKKSSIIASVASWSKRGDYSMASYMLRGYYFGKGIVDSLFPTEYHMKFSYGFLKPYAFNVAHGIIHLGSENINRKLDVVV